MKSSNQYNTFCYVVPVYSPSRLCCLLSDGLPWWQVGGGPTGVELAAEMHDYIKEDLAELFPTLKVCPQLQHLVNTFTSSFCHFQLWCASTPLASHSIALHAVAVRAY